MPMQLRKSQVHMKLNSISLLMSPTSLGAKCVWRAGRDRTSMQVSRIMKVRPLA